MEKKKIKHYRIGDYAQKMGVTPDLLKHYEKMDLIHAYTAENGYRYYPFTESIPLLECLSLRNYNISLQQMHEILFRGTIQDYQNALEEKAQSLKQRVMLEQALLEEYDVLSKWMACMKDQNLYMLIEEQEPIYFLPHSKRHDFLDDDRIQELLPKWIEWMPVVKSCRKIIYQEESDSLLDAVWGLAVPVSKAKTYGLPLNDAVECIPGGRQLICHYRQIRQEGQNPNMIWQKIKEKISMSEWKPIGPIQQVVLTTLFNPEKRISCGSFVIPMPFAVNV